MKRAIVFACLLALTTPAYAEAPGDTAGPITSQAQRDAIATRVHGGESCAQCDLFQIDLSYQNIGGRDFSGARIRQSDLSLATADRTRFHGANMSLANMFGMRASSADFTDTNLDGAGMVGGYYGRARFNGARLRGANLSGAELADALGLTQAQLNEACGDSSTTLPTGLTLPSC